MTIYLLNFLDILIGLIKTSAFVLGHLVEGLISDAFIYYFTSLVSILQLMCKYFAFFFCSAARRSFFLLLTDIKYI